MCACVRACVPVHTFFYGQEDPFSAINLPEDEQHVRAIGDTLHDAVKIFLGVEVGLGPEVPVLEARHELGTKKVRPAGDLRVAEVCCTSQVSFIFSSCC